MQNRRMRQGKQAPKRTTMQLNKDDWSAIERLKRVNPLIRTNSDAIRYALHTTADREEQSA